MRPPSHRLPRPSPYRWAVGAKAVSPGQTVDNRYIVISPNIWRDTQLGHDTPEVFTADGEMVDDALAPLQESLMPYCQLQQLRYAAIQAHLPRLDTVVRLNGKLIPLLQGGLDLVGRPYPTLYDLWKRASQQQQLIWLWQLCPLWEALAAVGAATSLLQPDNLRVDGDRLCLLSLVSDPSPRPPSSALGRLWLPWATYAGANAAELQRIAHQLQTAPSPQGLFSAEYQLNRLLLQTAAQPFTVRAAEAIASVEPVSLPVSHGSTAGLPLAAVCCSRAASPHLPSSSSHPLALQIVQSLALQVKVMGEELARCGLLSPRWVVPQILAMVRVLNNILLAQEPDEGLSLAFAIAVPQPVPVVDAQLEGQGSSSAPNRDPSSSAPSSAAQEVYAFTTGAGFVYQMKDKSWQRVVPSTTRPVSYLGESSDRLQGQLQRLVVDSDQLLLLSTYPLDDLLNQRQQLVVEALDADEVDLDAIAQWVMSKTTAKGAAAIALLHHQGERHPSEEHPGQKHPGQKHPGETISSSVEPEFTESESTEPAPPAPAPIKSAPTEPEPTESAPAASVQDAPEAAPANSKGDRAEPSFEPSIDASDAEATSAEPAPIPPQPLPDPEIALDELPMPASAAPGDPHLAPQPADARPSQSPRQASPHQVTDLDFEDDDDMSGEGDHDFDSAALDDLYSSINVIQPRKEDSISRYIDAEVHLPSPAFNTILDQDIDHGLSTLVSNQARSASPATNRDRPLRMNQSRIGQPRMKPVRTTPNRTTESRTAQPRTTPRDRIARRRRDARGQRSKTGRTRLLALLLLLALVGGLSVLIWQRYPDRFEPWLPSRQN